MSTRIPPAAPAAMRNQPSTLQKLLRFVACCCPTDAANTVLRNDTVQLSGNRPSTHPLGQQEPPQLAQGLSSAYAPAALADKIKKEASKRLEQCMDEAPGDLDLETDRYRCLQEILDELSIPDTHNEARRQVLSEKAQTIHQMSIEELKKNKAILKTAVIFSKPPIESPTSSHSGSGSEEAPSPSAFSLHTGGTKAASKSSVASHVMSQEAQRPISGEFQEAPRTILSQLQKSAVVEEEKFSDISVKKQPAKKESSDDLDLA